MLTMAGGSGSGCKINNNAKSKAEGSIEIHKAIIIIIREVWMNKVVKYVTMRRGLCVQSCRDG